MNDLILNIKQASEYTKYSVSYLYALVHKGAISYCKGTGRQGKITFLKSDLDAFVMRNRHAADFELQERANAYLQGAVQ